MKKLLLSALALLTMAGISTAQNVPSYVPTNGLVGWWPFNGNANDESGNGNNGTVNGATLTTDRNNVANSAYFFNGSAINQDYIQTGNPIGNSDSFSISFWISRSELSSNGKWSLMINSANNLPGSYEFICVEDTIYFRNWGNLTVGLNFDIKQKFPFTNNSFFNISVTSNLSTTKLFINGQFVAETNIPKVKPVDGDLFIGKHANFMPSSNSSFSGKIDDIAIYNRALSQQEITALYQGGNTAANCLDLPTNLQQGLVGYWPFCGNANDESGNGNNGIANQMVWGTDRFGKPNSAAEYNGNIQRAIRVPNPVGATGGQFTFSFWLKASGPYSIYNGIIDAKGSGMYCQMYGPLPQYISAGAYGKLGFSGYLGYNQSTTNVNDSSWHHGVMVIDWPNGNVKIYVDGNLDATRTFAPQTINPWTAIDFGNSFDNLNNPSAAAEGIFGGSLDDIAIWNRALSPQEITQLYNQGICQQSITVTDTLLIHTGITSWSPIAYQNTLKVWPNPGNQDITIDAGNLASMQGWKYKVANGLGQMVVSETAISQQQTQISLSSWGGNGIYYLHLINPQGIAVEIKKIVLAP